jgi:hypothetical protein
MRRVFVVLACLAGCTAANPNYVAQNGNAGSPGVGGVGSAGSSGAGGSGEGGTGGIGGSGGIAGSGGTGGTGGSGGVEPADMAMAHGDMAHTGQCGPGERSCTTIPQVTSESCENNQYVADRKCPFASVTPIGGAACSGGYCKAPTGQGITSCASNGGGRDLTCTQNGGGGAANVRSCQPFVTDAAKSTVEWVCAVASTTARGGAGDKCTNGPNDCHTGLCGANGTCFVACQSDNDCPGQIGCGSTKLTFEGVTISTKSCIP